MEKQILKRILAWLLTFAMVSSMFPVTAFAEEASKSAECIHSHDEFCGYVAAVEEVPCDKECTDTDGDGLIDHAEECAYTPAVQGQPCTHVHDESCGGVIVKQSEKDIEAEAPTEDTSDREESLLELIALLNELPDPMAYLADGTAKESILDGDQLAQARAAVDDWFAGEEEAYSSSAQEQEELQSLILRLEGLEHIRDTETDCLDMDCPYHYPEIIQEQMAEDETPKPLTLDDLVEDYGVEPPMQTFSRLRSAAVPHPQTLMLTEDNENNSHTGSPDGDIDKILSESDGNHPIEMSFTLTEVPTQSAYLAVKAYDVDEDWGETDYVYINDDIFEEYNDSTIGYLSGTDNTWNTTILRIPLEKLKVGKNTISVTIASGWVVEVDWMQLILDGGAVDSNIQEFSLKLENSAASENNVTVQSSVTVIQTGNVQCTTEYTLIQNETGNALDACFGTVLDSETIELSMPLDSPSGIYTITGILKDSETEQIKATDSVSFYFLQNVGLGPKISHTLTPDQLTNQDVTIQLRAEAVPEMGITGVSVSEDSKTVSANDSYSFTVNYTLNGNSQSVTYPVKVDNIDKQAPVIEYSTIAVSQGEEYETVKALFADNLSVSDNGTLASVPLSYTIPQDISNTSGAKTITVTATDAAGNTTTQNCTITVLAKPVKLTLRTLTAVSGSKDSYTLNAVLDSGSDTITETGFVWGVMPNPTLNVKNGSVTTASVVKATGETLTGTATGLLSGVEYYARAYAKVTETGGSTNVVYSEAGTFGFNTPSYGTFSVSSVSDSTFTITRTGGTDGAQTVYYRTVNGSAIGDTHFTHQAGTLTFVDGETSKTVTVAELGVTSAYNNDAGTKYSNADRTYSLEIYRVEGGGAIDLNQRSKKRTMTKNSSYSVDRSVYTTEKSKTQVAAVTGTSGQRVADTTEKQGGKDYANVRFLTNRYNATNYNTSSSFSTYYTDTDQAAYLNATATGWYYRYELRAFEEEDGYEHAYIGTSPLNDEQYTTGGKGYPVSGLGGQLWACTFLQGQKDTEGTYNFPDTRTGGGENSYYPKNSSGSYVSYNGKTYVSLGLTNTAYVYFGANGQNTDIWYVDGLTSYALVKDDQEPALLGIAPMAGGTYLPGDKITVALVFDEIVDSTNSSLGSVSINTNVGTLTYAGGADTNVLYFTGRVDSTANLNGSGDLKVTGINNSSYIKDMCSTAGTTSTPTSGSSNVIVDATKPTVTITANTSGSLPQHKATITATNANTLQYAWTQSTALPAYGWSNVTSGTTLTESRGAAGATETWYLHILATSSSGATTHECKGFSFMQPNITSVSVLEGTSSTSEDVTDVWKPSKYIVVTYAGAQTSDTMLSFAGPHTSSQDITAASGTKYLQVTKNGTYTVTLKDGYGSVISKTIEVKQIDAAAPTVTLRSGNSTEAGTVYNSLNIAVLPADAGGSGLAKVEYAWTNTNAAPSTPITWGTLTAASDGSYQAVYTATETTKTAKYLHVKVTDGAGNVSSVATSGPYQVIKKATGTALPSITVTGNPTAWTKSATLTWTAKKGTETGAGSIQTVYTPDRAVNDTTLNGTYTVTKNGVYPFVVIDANGNSASAEVNVTNVDSEAPKLTSLTAEGGKTNGTITLAGVTDDCTVIYDSQGNYSSISGSGLKTRQYMLESENTWTPFTGDSITVSKNGTYIIQLTDMVGNSREYSVKMEGIDATINQYTVTFNANGHGTAPSSQTVSHGGKAVQPDALTATGYVFGGWYKDAACTNAWNFTTDTVTSNVTLYAKWTPNTNTAYKVNHYTEDLEGGTWTLHSTVNETGITGASVTLANLKKSITGFTYKEGKAGGSVVTSTTILADGSREIDLYYTRDAYTLTLNQGTGISGVSGGGSYKYGQSVSVNATVSAGYTWENWTGTNTSTNQKFSFTMPASNVTLTANATINQYTVTFNANGHGTTPGSQTVSHGGKATEPDALTATGYVFGGWYEEAGCINKWDFSTDTVTSSITLYAKWTADAGTSYKVNHYTEDLTGGWTRQGTDSKTGTTGTSLTIANLAKSITGFTYKEGKAGGSVVTSTTILADGSREIDLYYTRNAYTLTLNQGTGISGVSGGGAYKYGQSVSVNATVSAGYTWENWTGTNTSTNQKFSFAMPASNVTLTANATINQYTVTFNANGHGTAPGSQTVSHGGKAVQPAALTATGYVFGGWYTDAACTDGKQFDFANTQVKANITLYAKWTLNEPSVTLTADGGTTNPVTGVIESVYNNGNTLIALMAEPSHAAAPEGSSSNITYTYQWYRDGQVLTDMDSTVRSLALKNVNQSGTYTVKVTAKDEEGRTSEAGSSNGVIVNIAKAPITFTVSENTHSYDATAKTASVEQTAGQTPHIDADGYEVSYEQNGKAVSAPTDAGTYDVIVNLKDNNFSHFGQSDSVTKQKVGELIIKKKQVTAVWTNLTAAYNGTAQAPECSTLVGLMEADAEEDVFADFTAEQRLTNAGTKRLTAALAGTRADNYRLTNPHVNFTVQKAPVTFAVADNVVQADGHAHKATVSAYANGAALDASNYAITYRNAAGQTVEEPADAGTYGIYAELINPNYRHSGTADGTACQIGVLTIYQNQTAKTYTVEYAKGASEVTGDLPTSQTGVSEGTLIYMPEEGNLARTDYAFTGWLLNGKLYQPGETFTMPANNVTITACWKEATYRISGVVDQEGKPLPHAVVTLKRGAEIIGETTTDTAGKYSFVGVIPGLYNLITSYDGITTTVKVLIVDADAEQNATLPAGRTNSILEVVAGAPAVVVGNLEKLFQISEGSNSPAYPEIYTDNDKNVEETGGTVEIRLTVEKVAEPDPTGAELLKEAMQKLPEAFDYQPELYLDLVLQKTVYPAEGSGSGSAVTKTLADSHVILESVISLPSNLQSRRFYKVYRIHQNEQGDILLQELTTQPNAEGEYYELNPENTELTIHARKYSVYTVAASDYVAPQPEKPESSGGAEGHPDNGAPEEEKVENSQVNKKPLEEEQKLPEEEKVKNSQVNKKPLEEEQKLPEESDPEAEKTEESPEEIPAEIPEDTLAEQEQREEPMPVGRNGKSFVVLNVLLTLLSLVMAVRLLLGSQERRRKIAGLTAAAASLLLLLLTLGFGGVRIADLRTILFTLLAAITVFMNLTGTKQDKEKSVL